MSANTLKPLITKNDSLSSKHVVSMFAFIITRIFFYRHTMSGSPRVVFLFILCETQRYKPSIHKLFQALSRISLHAR